MPAWLEVIPGSGGGGWTVFTPVPGISNVIVGAAQFAFRKLIASRNEPVPISLVLVTTRGEGGVSGAISAASPVASPKNPLPPTPTAKSIVSPPAGGTTNEKFSGCL